MKPYVITFFYSTYEGLLIDCTFLLLCCRHRQFETNDSIHHRRHLLVDTNESIVAPSLLPLWTDYEYISQFSSIYNIHMYIRSFVTEVQVHGRYRRKDKTQRKQCKISSSKKLTCKGTLRQVFICLRPRTPYPPLHNVYLYTVYLFTQGRGEGGGEGVIVEPERRLEGQEFTKLGRKYQHAPV